MKKADPLIGTLPQKERRDFSRVTYDEAMKRARDCVPILAERAEKAEQGRTLPRENEQLLHETGLFRFHQPKRFGGMELGFEAIVDVVAELARGCPSTAWCVSNYAYHHWLVAYYDQKTQYEVWDANPDALIASSIALAAGRGRRAEGGFVVTGRWPFSSGVDNSEWDQLAVTIYGEDGKTAVDWRLCLVPKSDYLIHDTWYAMGMAATGSKDVEVKELFVPERRALPLALCRGGREHPGAATNTGALFRLPVVATSQLAIGPAAIGCAEGAYETVVRSFARRTGTYTGAKVSEFQAVQSKLAKARCLIDSARLLMRESALAFQAYGERNEVPDLPTKLRLRAHTAFAVGQLREAVETLWSFYGAAGLYTRDPLQRYFRDMQAMSQHFSFNFDITGAAYGLAALGGAYSNPVM